MAFAILQEQIVELEKPSREDITREKLFEIVKCKYSHITDLSQLTQVFVAQARTLFRISYRRYLLMMRSTRSEIISVENLRYQLSLTCSIQLFRDNECSNIVDLILEEAIIQGNLYLQETEEI